jgi:hypothetical protein
VLALVLPILVARHRASSNIENLNSVLRPYLAVQKHAQPGMGAPQGDLGPRGPHGRGGAGLAHVPRLPAEAGRARGLTAWPDTLVVDYAP